MNKHDRNNLEFLLNAGEDTLKEWYNSVTEDDRVYASELLRVWSLELMLKAVLLSDPEIDSLTEANQILKKVKNSL
jgi:hypothetical protein